MNTHNAAPTGFLWWVAIDFLPKYRKAGAETLFICMGKHLWCSFRVDYASPPDQSGGYAQEILTGFYFLL